jgi:hypothetical protein
MMSTYSTVQCASTSDSTISQGLRDLFHFVDGKYSAQSSMESGSKTVQDDIRRNANHL